MMTVSGQPTVPSNDILLNRNDALRVLAAADSGRIYQSMVISLSTNIDTLWKRVSILQQINSNYKEVVILKDSVISTYEKEKEVMTKQRQLLESQISNAMKLYKQQKRRKILVGICGIVAAGAAYWLGTQ